MDEETTPVTSAMGPEARPRRRGARRGGTFDRDLTQGSIVRNLLALAAPLIAGNIVNTLDTTIDMVWVARLGAAPIAGVGIAGELVWLLGMARQGLTIGQRAMVSRFVGANDMDAAEHVAVQSFLISVFFGVIMIGMGVVFAEPLMRVMGVSPDVVREGATYMRIMVFGATAMSFRMMAEAAMQASGDTVTPMKIIMGIRVFHIIIAPFLIFGWAGLPRLEVSGAALANVLTQSVGTAIGFYILTSGRTRLHWHLGHLKVHLGTMWRIVKIGLPASINSLERQLATMMLLRILTPFGTYAVAAYSVDRRVDSLVQTFGRALGMATGVMVGQNLGAGKPERSYRSAWTAMGLGSVIMGLGGVVLFLWAEDVVRIFNPDPELVKIASGFVRIATLSFIFLCGVSVFSQALNGAGDTVPPMVASIISFWGIELPLAWFLPRATNLDVYGIRWAIVIAYTMRMVMYVSWFQLGRWKRKKV